MTKKKFSSAYRRNVHQKKNENVNMTADKLFSTAYGLQPTAS